MSLCKSRALNEKQADTLNSLSSKSIQKSQFTRADFKEVKLFNQCIRAQGIVQVSDRMKQRKKDLGNYEISFFDKLSSIITTHDVDPKGTQAIGSVGMDVLENSSSSKILEINDWFKPKPLKLFKKAPPIGLTEKVRKHLEFIKNIQEHRKDLI